jgi:hypothetical protein
LAYTSARQLTLLGIPLFFYTQILIKDSAMNNNISVMDILGDCEVVAEYLTQVLNNSGYEVIRSFDLQRAREVHTSCACSYHGTADCNCQLIILLVYLQTEQPRTLVLHGKNGVSHLGWGDELSPQDESMMLSMFKEVAAMIASS